MSAGSSLSTWFVVMKRILPSVEVTPSMAFNRPLNVNRFKPWYAASNAAKHCKG
jgi:hypothetical protein